MKEQINNDTTAYKVLWPAPACLSRHLLSPTLPRVTLIFSTLQFLKHIKHVPGHSLPRSLHGQHLTILSQQKLHSSGETFPDHPI